MNNNELNESTTVVFIDDKEAFDYVFPVLLIAQMFELGVDRDVIW